MRDQRPSDPRSRPLPSPGPLTRAESVDWLGSEEGVGRDGTTLAELFALRRGTTPDSVTGRPSDEDAGLYL